MSMLYLFLAVLPLLVGQTAGEEGKPVVPRNIFQDGACALIDGFGQLMGSCYHGLNCGGGCAPYQNVSFHFLY